MKYTYDYQNIYTRGWVRGEFEDYGLNPNVQSAAVSSLEAVARTWSTGTDLRLVQIADDGTETFPPVTMKGIRGPLPKDKKSS